MSMLIFNTHQIRDFDFMTGTVVERPLYTLIALLDGQRFELCLNESNFETLSAARHNPHDFLCVVTYYLICWYDTAFEARFKHCIASTQTYTIHSYLTGDPFDLDIDATTTAAVLSILSEREQSPVVATLKNTYAL